jgi:hypothetical protein
MLEFYFLIFTLSLSLSLSLFNLTMRDCSPGSYLSSPMTLDVLEAHDQVPASYWHYRWEMMGSHGGCGKW